jgi:hypothetical protein
MVSRRNFLSGAWCLITAAVGGRGVSKVAMAALPEPVSRPARHHAAAGAAQRPPLQPGGHAQRLDLPWRMNNGVKEFHLVAEPVVREMAPGFKATCGATTARAPARPSRWSRATGCASSSPTSCPSTPASTGTASACPTAWTASRPDAAADPAGQDLRLRVRGAPPRHLHVPPACRRDGADGDGHDGLLGHPPEGKHPLIDEVTATSASCSTPTTSSPAATRRRS